MSRSLKVAPQYIGKVKLALKRSGFPNQKALAERVGVVRSTINNFLNGKPVDYTNFVEICEKLGLDWQAIANIGDATAVETEQSSQPSQEQSEQENNINIDALVQEVREKVKPFIQDWCGTIQVLDMTKPIGLCEIYTDVNILEKLTERRLIGIEELRKNVEPKNFDRFGLGKVSEPRVDALEAVKTYPKLMVWGNAGAGKTTFLKYLAIQCIENKILKNLVPIYIEIEQFAESSGVRKLQNFLTHLLLQCGVDDTTTSNLLKEGRLFILLDGLDEVKEEDSPRILKQIKYFFKTFNKNQFVMTCRIAGQNYSPENFIEVEVAEFDDNQINKFATKWFQAQGNLQKSKKFIKKLNANNSIKELANSPLLLTLLCWVFTETAELPPNRFDLYREAIEILLVKWDAKREKERRRVYKELSASKRRDLLSYIAYKTFEEGEYFFTLDDLNKHISDYLSKSPSYAQTEPEELLVYSEDVVKSIESQHGLLVQRAQRIYSFSHLTFHEYFTARKIAFPPSPQEFEKALQGLANHIIDERWREVFLRVAERLEPADYIIQLMKDRVDNLVAKNDNIQKFLEWLNQKSLSFKVQYKQSSIRAFYINADLEIDVDRKLGCLIDFTCTCVFTCASLLTRILNRELTETVNKAQELASDIANDNEIEPDIAIALERGLAMDIIERDFSSELEPELRQKLQQLKAQLPDRNADEEKFKQWWNVNGRNWADQVRVLIVYNHEIGEDHWQSLSEDDQQLLRQYYYANVLLMECMKSANMSREQRLEIEDTLLLPIAEIERLKNKG